MSQIYLQNLYVFGSFLHNNNRFPEKKTSNNLVARIIGENDKFIRKKNKKKLNVKMNCLGVLRT